MKPLADIIGDRTAYNLGTTIAGYMPPTSSDVLEPLASDVSERLPEADPTS